MTIAHAAAAVLKARGEHVLGLAAQHETVDQILLLAGVEIRTREKPLPERIQFLLSHLEDHVRWARRPLFERVSEYRFMLRHDLR